MKKILKMKKLILKIKLFFNRSFQTLLALWRDKAHIGIQAVNIMKDVVNSPMAGYVVNLTKGNWDNALLEKLRVILPCVAEKLLITDTIIRGGRNGTPSQSEIIHALIEYLRSQNTNIRNEFYLKLAAAITQALADDKITFNEACAIAQLVYDETKHGR